MYEQRHVPPLSRPRFLRRLWWHVLTAVMLLAVSVFAGAVALMHLETLPLSEAVLHASTLISGLGLAEMPRTGAGRLFTSLFALYSGFVALAVSGIMIAPVAHRMLHCFHWDGEHTMGSRRTGPSD
ncbi:hypothetical protein [Tritonibacter scottomollicae]|uniref:hypothetical protein n=1 Tax=Tritonibacter scottomollicae TaxID=483013 RepID=UPI003AA7ECF3